jgi:hypothetical protein
MCCYVLGFAYPVLYLYLFKASILFSAPSFYLLSELSSLFMSEKIGLCQVVRYVELL